MLLQTDPCSLEHVCLNINQFCHFGCWNVNSILHDLCSQYLLLLPRSNAYWGLMGRRAPHQTPRKLTARVSLGAQLSAKISWSTQLNRCVHQLVQFINKITNLYKFTVVFNLAGFNLMKPDHWHTPWGSLKRALEPLCSLLRGMPLLASMRFRMLWWWTHSTGVFRWGCDKTRGAKMCKNGRGGSEFMWHYMALILDCLRTVIGSKTLFRNIFVWRKWPIWNQRHLGGNSLTQLNIWQTWVNIGAYDMGIHWSETWDMIQSFKRCSKAFWGA